MRLIQKHIVSLLLTIIPFFSISQTIDLSGKWKVELKTKKQEAGVLSKTEGGIQLPGSLAEAGYGVSTSGSDFGLLTPTHKYIGKAVYSHTFSVPKSWKQKHIKLFLERVLWESVVYIDGKEISKQDALGTAHVHSLGQLNPGLHQISIQVNNDLIHNIGDKGHAYGDYTQGIWNGIVGRMELVAKDDTYINTIKTYPKVKEGILDLKMDVHMEKADKTQFSIHIKEVGSTNDLFTQEVKRELHKGEQELFMQLNVGDKLRKWSEFDPAVYELMVCLKSKGIEDTIRTEFGYREVGHDGTHILVNGEPVFLRGNLDCVHFPLTGYPSTQLEDWISIFKKYKDYGLNHVRFHSWCPPEAAFRAADRVGIYIQAEASIWIDYWMSEDMKAKGRPEMDTKGHPKGLGHDPKRDQFVVEEMNRVVSMYGNHPSFVLFGIGNELGNSDFSVMNKWIGTLKRKDPRRLYAASTARTITETDDYSATHYIQDVGGTRGLRGARTDWDFEEVYGKMNIPIIAHEIGQWPVYPSWKEIDKYKGVLKARNLEEFRTVALKNGIADQDEAFKQASGALSQLMYKYETESFLRTKSCAGVQLLSMQDYQGQGEALIGWLDAHWDSKGITTPAKFREHFSETVPLLRMEKFVWTNTETFTASAQLSHYGQYALPSNKILAEIKDDNGQVLFNETWNMVEIKRGSLVDIGKISLPLNAVQKAHKLTISITVLGTAIKNSWNIWVYPAQADEPREDDILISKQLDAAAMDALRKGKRVLLQADQLGTESNSVAINFYPLYWSLTFFPGQGKTSIGMLVQDKHPAFRHFPTDFHSDWQWESISKSSKGFILNETPKGYKPIVQLVDDFHRNNKEGAVFEFGVGKGKLLVCGFKLDAPELPAARQLRHSLIAYMKSPEFNPRTMIAEDSLKAMFPKVRQAEEGKASLYQQVLLQVKAAKALKQKNTSLAWSATSDSVTVKKEGLNYQVQADGVWKDNIGTAWHGKEMTIEIECPDGILGTLYVWFDDWNKQGRTGSLAFEGRKVTLGDHQQAGGKWVKFHVMREDSNDGKLILKAKATRGGNLMIRELVLDQE